MKERLPANLEKWRVHIPYYEILEPGSIQGAFAILYRKKRLKVISGIGNGWDHVSVSLGHRCPTWEEMSWVKNQFFQDDELVIQFHPPKSQYINLGKHVLHLWRPWDQKIELPPRWMLVLD